jgi:hypothetical protein
MLFHELKCLMYYRQIQAVEARRQTPVFRRSTL